MKHNKIHKLAQNFSHFPLQCVYVLSFLYVRLFVLYNIFAIESEMSQNQTNQHLKLQLTISTRNHLVDDQFLNDNYFHRFSQ